MSNQLILTPLELKIMQILWDMGKGLVKDILERWTDDTRPAYNTISTVVRLLQEQKNCIGHRSVGRHHEYFPLVSREDYQKGFMRNTLDRVFGGSVSALLSTLVSNEQISEEEINELKKLLE